MAAAGMMQLHHEYRALARGEWFTRLGFAGAFELALAAVFVKAHGGQAGSGWRVLSGEHWPNRVKAVRTVRSPCMNDAVLTRTA